MAAALIDAAGVNLDAELKDGPHPLKSNMKTAADAVAKSSSLDSGSAVQVTHFADQAKNALTRVLAAHR